MVLPPPKAFATAKNCENAATQAEINECAGKAFKDADARLNAVYNDLLGRFKGDADRQKLLISAQRAWITLRDADCAFIASGVEGGSLYPTILSDCLKDETHMRLDTLQRMFDCREGDLTCPVP
ncbi:lysozyme inhibitor LprI family protein [Beijerinckia mobilis]|uniref:lysozyme inhibitor LprI family protein n=1 Tax=Beijerinckia mobilis TaxID=231434 RepID=UPI00068F45E6|nr:lysozyme inhibitor LprI family protein [Beijerinckia mobilis]